MKTILIVVASVFAFAGCLVGREGFLRTNGSTRAAFELKCPEKDLRIVEINSTTVGVEGCDQSAIYKLVQTGQNMMDWVRD